MSQLEGEVGWCDREIGERNLESLLDYCYFAYAVRVNAAQQTQIEGLEV